MLVLALESSTSSAKVMLYDSDLGIVDVVSSEYDSLISKGNIADTEGVFRLTMELGKRLASGREIAAIAVCGTWHSIAICDKKLNPVQGTYYWNYMEPAESCLKIRKNIEMTNELYTRTGCMPHVTYMRQAMLYLKENGLSFEDKLLISQGAYNFYKLTDEYCESRATVSGAGLLNIHELEYDDYVLDLLGIGKDQLGRLVSRDDIVPLSKEGADFLNLSAGIPVVPAHPDGALNQYICDYNPRNMSLSVGTSGALRMNTEQPVLPESHALWCYYGVDSRISGAATAGACNCINWFVRKYVDDNWNFDQLEQTEDIEKKAPIFLPFLFGERCPGWNDDRRAAFFDIDDSHSIKDTYRAVQAGIVFNLFQCYNELKKVNGEANKIVLSGGILNSESWTQMLADIFEVEIACMETIDASTLGAAALALQAAGESEKADKMRENNILTAKTILPRPGLSSYYKEQYDRYLYYYSK